MFFRYVAMTVRGGLRLIIKISGVFNTSKPLKDHQAEGLRQMSCLAFMFWLMPVERFQLCLWGMVRWVGMLWPLLNQLLISWNIHVLPVDSQHANCFVLDICVGMQREMQIACINHARLEISSSFASEQVGNDVRWHFGMSVVYESMQCHKSYKVSEIVLWAYS